MPPDSGANSGSLPIARLAHLCEGRARWVIEERKQDTAFFDRLARSVSAISGVRQALARAATGSLIVLFDGEPKAVVDGILDAGLFVQSAPPDPISLIQTLIAEAATLDRGLRQATHGSIAVPDAGILFFLLIGLIQLARGRIDISALSAFWYAANILLSTRGAKDGNERVSAKSDRSRSGSV